MQLATALLAMVIQAAVLDAIYNAYTISQMKLVGS